jgi:hypothetical protein
MSVYLYLHCRDCDEFTDVIGRNTQAVERWYIYTGSAEAMKEVNIFLVKHMGHNVTLANEGVRYPESPPWGFEKT